MRQWTPEARARQSEAIRKWKPWARSTGPKTPAGKYNSSRNAYKHGARSASAKNLNACLSECAAFRRDVEKMLKRRRMLRDLAKNLRKQTIILPPVF